MSTHFFTRALVFAIVVGGVAGCGSGDTEQAVATVAVTPARTRVVVGGPLDLTYRFAPLPGATLSANYKVFVHLVDSDGRVLWYGDHDPEVPTSTWKQGQTIEYRRTAFLPTAGLTPGDATLLVGLYGDERVPLQGGIAPARDRAYPVANLQLAPESERILPILTTGWHGEEHGEDASITWAWTMRAGGLAFKNPKADVVLYLDYDARPDAFAGAPQRVSVTALGQPVASFLADSPTRRLERVTIPAAALGGGDMADLKIEVDRAFVPASLPAGGRDERELGIRVYHAFVDRR